MDKTKLNAIISLLDDPNELVYSSIKKNVIAECNEADCFLLEELWNSNRDPLVMERVEDLLHEIKFKSILEEIRQWKEKRPNDLFEILFLISKVFYHEINRQEIWNTYQKIQNEIWLELNNNLTALEKIRLINHILFKKYRLKSENIHSESIKHFFVTELIRNKKGNDLSLGLLYMLICQDLNLPVYGVNLPDNFILAYTNESSLIYTLPEPVDPNQILFYINPLNFGSVFNNKEIDNYLDKKEIKRHPYYYQAQNNKMVIHHYLAVLLDQLEQEGKLGIYEELLKVQSILIEEGIE